MSLPCRPLPKLLICGQINGCCCCKPLNFSLFFVYCFLGSVCVLGGGLHRNTAATGISTKMLCNKPPQNSLASNRGHLFSQIFRSAIVASLYVCSFGGSVWGASLPGTSSSHGMSEIWEGNQKTKGNLRPRSGSELDIVAYVNMQTIGQSKSYGQAQNQVLRKYTLSL